MVVVVEMLSPIVVAVVLLEVVVFVIVIAVYNSSIVSDSSLGSLLLSSVYVSNNHAFVGVEVDGRFLERAEEGQNQQFRRNLRRRQERPEVRLGPRRQRVARTAPGSHRKDVDVWVEIPTSAETPKELGQVRIYNMPRLSTILTINTYIIGDTAGRGDGRRWQLRGAHLPREEDERKTEKVGIHIYSK